MNRKSQSLDNLIENISRTIENKILLLDNKVSLHAKVIESYNLKRALERGFVLVEQNSKFVTRAKIFSKQMSVKLQFLDGEVEIRKE